jgi:LPS export ABC transporter protein LptC
MQLTAYKRPRRLKILLLAVILTVCAVVMAIFGVHRSRWSDGTPGWLPFQQGTTLSMNRLTHTATRNGIKEWTLRAASAEYMHTSKQALLEDLAVTFFLEDRGEVHLTAEKGILQTDSNDIQVAGHVAVVNQGMRLTAETLTYNHTRRTISTTRPVAVHGPDISLRADAMTLDLVTQYTELTGQVEGEFSDAPVF